MAVLPTNAAFPLTWPAAVEPFAFRRRNSASRWDSKTAEAGSLPGKSFIFGLDRRVLALQHLTVGTERAKLGVNPLQDRDMESQALNLIAKTHN